MSYNVIPIDPFVLAAKLGVDITNTDGRINGSAGLRRPADAGDRARRPR